MFENLAGNPTCDVVIARELQEAGVPMLHLPARLDHPDVKASILGQLGAFTFQRLWYYWSVRGPVPLDVAERLYANPVGEKEVRAGGDCACRPPETWAKWYDAEGRQLVTQKDYGEVQAFVDRRTLPGLILEGLRASQNRSEDGKGYVPVYHIDTAAGLRLFVEAIRDLPAEVPPGFGKSLWE